MFKMFMNDKTFNKKVLWVSLSNKCFRPSLKQFCDPSAFKLCKNTDFACNIF